MLASGLVLEGPLLPAIEGAAKEPLAFTVLDVANRLTTGGASNSVPGCGPRSRGVRGSLADRRAEGKKSFMLRDHARRNFWVFNGLGRDFDSLTAHPSLPQRAGL